MKRPAQRAARRSTFWLAMALAACSDPGSGGTGVPGDASSVAAPTPPPAGTPAPSAPGIPVNPPPGSAPAAGAAPACAAPANASAASYAGIIEAQSDGCLLVGGRSILITGARIVRRSGAAAEVAELVPGSQVTVEPDPADPGRAHTVTIDDIGT